MNEKNNALRKKPEKQSLLQTYSAIIASIVVILAGIHYARGVLGPVFMACFFTVLLVLPVNWLRSKGMKSWLALSLVILGTTICGLGTITVVASQLAQFAKNIPEYRDRFSKKLEAYDLGVEIDELFPFLKSSAPKEGDAGTFSDREEQEKAEFFDELRSRFRLRRDGSTATVKGGREPQRRETADKRSGERHTSQDELDDRSEKLDEQECVEEEPTRLASYDEPLVAQVASTLAAPIGKVARGSEDLDPQPIEEPAQSLVPAAPSTAWAETTPDPNLSLSAPPAFFPDDDVDDATAMEQSEQSDSLSAETAETLPEQDDVLTDEELEELFRSTRPTPSPVSAVDASSQELFRFLRGLVGELSYLGSNAFLMTLLVIFMLCETAKIPKKLVAVIGRRRFANTHIEGVIADIRNYMVIKTWMSCAVGVLVTILCVVSKVQYPLLWGFVAFLLNYIPNIGSVAAAIPPLVLATIDHGLVVGAIDAVFFVLINCLIGYGLEPRLLGDGLDLSPLIVLIALIFFGWLLGPVGMFLSPPLAVVMKIIFQSFPETRWLAALMANKPPKESVDPDDDAEVAA